MQRSEEEAENALIEAERQWLQAKSAAATAAVAAVVEEEDKEDVARAGVVDDECVDTNDIGSVVGGDPALLPSPSASWMQPQQQQRRGQRAQRITTIT